MKNLAYLLLTFIVSTSAFAQEIPAAKASRQKRHIARLLNELGVEFEYGGTEFLSNYDENDIVILGDVWEDANNCMIVINTDSYLGDGFDFIDIYAVGYVQKVNPGQVESLKVIPTENANRFTKLYLDDLSRPQYVYRTPISSYTELTASDLKFIAVQLGYMVGNLSVAD